MILNVKSPFLNKILESLHYYNFSLLLQRLADASYVQRLKSMILRSRAIKSEWKTDLFDGDEFQMWVELKLEVIAETAKSKFLFRNADCEPFHKIRFRVKNQLKRNIFVSNTCSSDLFNNEKLSTKNN